MKQKKLLLWRLLPVITCQIVILVSSHPIFAQGKAPDVIYREILPSIVTLSVNKADGSTVSGSAFLAVDNKVAVTTLSLLENATGAVATFSSGEEFDVSGIIDKDEKRNLAIIRIKVFGGPLLDLTSTDPPIGSRAYLIGSPEGKDFTITDGLVSSTKIEGGVKSYQFTCPAGPGNAGGALVNDQGQVIGIVSSIGEGQGLNSAIPSVFALGLDATLPTKPWQPAATMQPPKPVAPAPTVMPAAPTAPREDIDPAAIRVQFYIAEDLKAYNNNRQLWVDAIEWWADNIKEKCTVKVSNIEVRQNDRQSLPRQKGRFTTKLSGWDSWVHGEAKLKEYIGKTNSTRDFHIGLFKEMKALRDEKWFEISGHYVYPNVAALKEKTTRVGEDERMHLIGHLFGLQKGDGGVMSIFYPRGPGSDPAYGNLTEWPEKWCGKIENHLGN
jgi:hypothetical protein